MRLTGQIAKLKGAPKVAPHVQKKIDKANTKAKRTLDCIDPNELKPGKIRGRGAYKQWCNEACLLAAWGRQLSLKKKDSAGSLRGAVSSRVMADFFEASHSHIRKVRGALAFGFMTLQRMFLATLPLMLHVIWVCSLDESEFLLTSESQISKHHVQMVHFVLAARVALSGPLLRKQIVASPATLLNQTAVSLYMGLMSRAPIPLLTLAAKTKRICLILNSDSANACKALGSHMLGTLLKIRDSGAAPAMLYFLHMFCLMHQVSLIINGWLSLLFLVNPIYCALSLMSSSTNMDAMKKALRALCDDLHVTSDVVDKPTPEEIKYGEALLGHLEWGDDAERDAQHRSEGAAKRRALRDKLAKFLIWRRGKWMHYCDGVFCSCTTPTNAKDTLFLLLMNVFVSHMPSPPVQSRWTKLMPPLLWFGVGAFLPLRLLFRIFSAVKGNAYTHTGEEVPMTADDLAGTGTDDTEEYQRRQGVRWLKANRFIRNVLTPLRLLVSMVVLRPVISLIGVFFLDATAGGLDSTGVMSFLHSSTSPAVAAMERYFELLRNMNHEFWLVLTYFDGWTQLIWAHTFRGCAILLGQIYLRLYWRFRRWPFWFGTWFHPNATDHERAAIRERYRRLNRCCCDLGFTRPARDQYETPEAVEADAEMVTFIRDTFNTCPTNNIGCEFRFARCQTYCRNCHAKPPGPETFMAKHVLTESHLIHRACLERQKRFDPRLALLDKPATSAVVLKKAKQKAVELPAGSWKAFMAHTSEQDWGTLGSQWAALTPTAKKLAAPKREATSAPPALRIPSIDARIRRVNIAPEELCSGSVRYPLSDAQAARFTQHVSRTFTSWCDYVRKGISVGLPEGAEPPLKPSTRICADTFGDRCGSCMTGQQRAYLVQMRRIAYGILTVDKPQPAVHAPLQPPGLYAITGSKGRRTIVLCLTLIGMPARGAYLHCVADAELVPGSEVHVLFQLDSLIEGRDFAIELAYLGNPLKVLKLEYVPRGDYTSFEHLVLTGIKDETALVIAMGKSTLSADDESADAHSGSAIVPSDPAAPPTPAPKTRSSSAPPAKHKAMAALLRKSKPGATAEAKPAPDAAPKPTARPAPKRRFKIRADGHTPFDLPPNFDAPPVPLPAPVLNLLDQDAPIDLQAGAAELLGPEEPKPEWLQPELQLVAVDAEKEQHAQFPKHDPCTHAVYYPDYPNAPIGAITVHDANTPKEKYFIKCKRHGANCAKIISAKRCPPNDLILEWFHYGYVDLNHGAEFADAHKRQWFKITGIA